MQWKTRAFSIAAVAILVYALLSRRLDRWWFSMPVVMVLVGLVVGADGLGLIGIDLESETVKTIAEVTLSLMLFHDAVRIDLRALRRGFAVPAAAARHRTAADARARHARAWWMLPAIGLVGALLVATMLAPTDAALGAAVVEDERLPMRIRQGLNVESGLNDGLSVPVFLVALALAADPTGWQAGALGAELLRQIGFGVLGGLLVGGLGGLAFRFAAREGPDARLLAPRRQSGDRARLLRGCRRSRRERLHRRLRRRASSSDSRPKLARPRTTRSPDTSGPSSTRSASCSSGRC